MIATFKSVTPASSGSGSGSGSSATPSTGGMNLGKIILIGATIIGAGYLVNRFVIQPYLKKRKEAQQEINEED